MTSAGGQASNARQAYASLPQSVPWWQTAIAGGLGAAGSYFTGGFVGGKS